MKSLLLPALLVASVATGAHAEAMEATAASANVTVKLVSEVRSIEPGKPFSVAIQMTMAPGWHTYWKNPGDSGMPTRVVWTLPDGFKASELQWPRPIRAVDAGLALYGYEHDATFLAEITPSPELPKGRFMVSAKLSWLECKDICIPGKATIDLTVPLAEGTAASALDPAAKPLFTAARASLPKAAKALKVSHAVKGDRLILTISGLPPAASSPMEFFPETSGLIEAAEPQTIARAGTSWTISMKRAANAPAAPASLRGVLVAKTAAKPIAYDVSALAEN